MEARRGGVDTDETSVKDEEMRTTVEGDGKALTKSVVEK